MHNLIGSCFLRFHFFLFYRIFFFYICCCLTNHIWLTMSLTNLGLNLGPGLLTLFDFFLYMLNSPLLVFWGITPDPLVHTIFVIFLFVLKSLLPVFFSLISSHQKELIPKVVKSFQYFCAQIEILVIPSKFQNQLYIFSPLCSDFEPTESPTTALFPAAWSIALHWVTSGNVLILLEGIYILEPLSVNCQ